MTTLTLQITNFQELPDGGPLRYRSQGRNFEIGRDLFRDWVLPDAMRSISGRHAEIRFDGQNYYLNDVSTNGTFVNGASQRVKSPYRIFNGDKFEIGNYVIVAHLQEEGGQRDFTGPETAFDSDNDDIWGGGSDSQAAPPQMSRGEFQAARKVTYAQPDFANSVFNMPTVGDRPAFPQGQQGFPPATQQGYPELPRENPGHANEFPLAGLRHPDNPFAGESGFSRPTPGAANWMPQPSPSASSQPDALSGQPSARANGFMDAFVRASKLSPATVQGRNQVELGEELGEMMLVAVELMMALLNARASAKSIIRSSNRTMLGPLDNNPLKFVPGAAAALDTMMGQGRGGYLDGRRAFREAFDDLKNHEVATYSAMQKAIFRLLEDELAPDAIEKKVSKSTFANSKAKAWETYVASWNSKVDGRENGMLDVFLAYFAEAYREATSKRG